MPHPVSNPPNPWLSTSVEWLEEPPPARLEVFEERAGGLLSQNDSPDVPFRWSVNPYRGCQHACAYCYARPGHQYLSFGAGTDFERKLVVKVNAPEVLRDQLRRPSWKREPIAFSGVTDCYQPLEASYELTRRCLEVAWRANTPVGIITKAALVQRDVDLLARIARDCGARVYLSIPFHDERMARKLEPGASAIGKRFEAIRTLSAAGIETGVAIAPIIPGLNEPDIPKILARAREAGARHAFPILLRLPAEVETVFRERLEAALPDRAAKVFTALSDMRGGRVRDSRFGARMRGSGARWKAVEDLFRLHARKLGFVSSAEGTSLPVGKPRAVQGELFA